MNISDGFDHDLTIPTVFPFGSISVVRLMITLWLNRYMLMSKPFKLEDYEFAILLYLNTELSSVGIWLETMIKCHLLTFFYEDSIWVSFHAPRSVSQDTRYLSPVTNTK